MFPTQKNIQMRIVHIFLLLIFLVITIGITLIYLEFHQHNMIQKNRFSYELDKNYEADTMYNEIANDIYDKKPITKSEGGRWEDYELENFLGFFELLRDYVDAGSLNLRDVFDYFSDDILLTYNSPKVMAYIHKIRAEGKDSTYYEGFEKMAKQFDKWDKSLKTNK